PELTVGPRSRAVAQSRNEDALFICYSHGLAPSADADHARLRAVVVAPLAPAAAARAPRARRADVLAPPRAAVASPPVPCASPRARPRPAEPPPERETPIRSAASAPAGDASTRAAALLSRRPPRQHDATPPAKRGPTRASAAVLPALHAPHRVAAALPRAGRTA